MASRPMPIHHPGRDLRTEPHESEPAHSYDDNHHPLLEEEDEFHQRLSKGRNHNNHSGGSSFWRPNATQHANGTSEGPAFNSVSLRTVTTVQHNSSTGLLGAALQSSASQGNVVTQHEHQMRNRSEAGTASTATNTGSPSHHFNHRRWDSDARSSGGSLSAPNLGKNSGSAGGGDSSKSTSKKQRDQQRRLEARLKRESLENQVEAGHAVDAAEPHHQPPTSFADLMNHNATTLDRSSSDQSTGSILYGKTPSHGALYGKSSLIFPTGVESGDGSDKNGNQRSSSGGDHHSNAANSKEARESKQRKINLLLDQCETVRFPFKKKLILSNLHLVEADLPVQYLRGTALGNALHKLSLAGNPDLGSIPEELVQQLPTLKHLDLSQCRLHSLPSKWNLPQLKKLDLSNNLLRDFPEESMLEGLPELQDLNMFGNKVTEIVVPHNPALLSRLEILDLGYNDIAYLPDELDQIRSLRVFKVRNNFLTRIPMRVCDMDLKQIDVSSNPVNQPPLETCERGICSMKRYYQQVRMEDQAKERALENLQHRVISRGKNKKKDNGNATTTPPATKKKGTYGKFMQSLSLSKASPSMGSSRKNTTGSSAVGSSSPLAHVRQTTPPSAADAKKALQHQQPRNTPQVSIPAEALVKPALATEDSDGVAAEGGSSGEVEASAAAEAAEEPVKKDITVNDTLKVIFVGMAMVGKTSMIKRLIEGKHAIVPTDDERTVGVDIYAWDPKTDVRFEHLDSRIAFQDEELAQSCGDVDVKFSVWDFAGQHVYHATHELFFSSNALYVLVWDMGAKNKATLKRKSSVTDERGDFKLSYDSESENDGDEEEADRSTDGFLVQAEEDDRRANRALERDIDEKVQFWVDCIQSSAPGAAILPVASFADSFDDEGGQAEARRRCNMLRERLLRHEQRRIQGIERRLQEYKDQNRADDPSAHRLQNLLCAASRPKLIFGEGSEDPIVRVSGTEYFGFDVLTEKLFNIATGRYRGRWKYPIFHGHVGTRIPRMRLQVRDVVRNMRNRFKVVEWGYFLNQLREKFSLTSVEDISDALHFLTSIGELSYFGSVMPSNRYENPEVSNGVEVRDDMKKMRQRSNEDSSMQTSQMTEDEDELDDDNAILSMDETSITAPGTEDGSLATVEDFMASGLSQFVFLNPRWLVAAVACILRHDLDREIKDTRRNMEGKHILLDRAGSFQEASLNCPVITAEDALMLWQHKNITKKAAERAQEYSNNMTVTPFEFLQLLLIRFGVFVPIDLSIEKALLGGKEYAKLVDSIEDSGASSPDKNHPIAEVTVEHSTEELALKAKFFFLPSLLGPGEPSEAWTYKTTESWKTTLCHSVLFPDGVPPGLMERLTASVLSSVYAVANRQHQNGEGADETATYEGRLTVREVLCWRTAFFLKLGTAVSGSDGTQKESIVEIFCHLAERDSHLCVGSDHMAVGTRRIIVSGRGQVGDGGRKIWKGGYLLVCKCITRVMEGYGGLEYETQAFCPDCLAKKSVSEASWWEFTTIRAAVKNAEPALRCHHHGHVVDTRFVAGPVDSLIKPKPIPADPGADPGAVPVQEMLGAVVLIGLWDGKARKVVRAGSGVIVDRRRGLIVTAAHTLMNVWGDSKYPFGKDYYGLRQGKVVIGVIPDAEEAKSKRKGMAVFRYFAKIVAKDPMLEQGECHLDACVLRITTKLEQDVGGNGEECGDQPEIILLNNEKAFKEENLKVLKISEKCELEEPVRVIGFNQGGEGLLGPGESLNRFADFARGYVCKLGLGLEFAGNGAGAGSEQGVVYSGGAARDCFKPREEIAVICPTIGGHSGGPCVNQQGEVIGILSRADPADNQRCYLSPASEWKPLIKQARKSDG